MQQCAVPRTGGARFASNGRTLLTNSRGTTLARLGLVPPPLRPLGEILIQDYHVLDVDVREALEAQKQGTPDRLGQFLVRRGILSDRDLATALGQQPCSRAIPITHRAPSAHSRAGRGRPPAVRCPLMRSALERALDEIRPHVQADGGDIELVELAGSVARVRLTGVCAGCPSSHMTLHLGVETALRRLHPDLRVALVA